MSSRERMLAAINHREADHVPLLLHIFEAQNILPPELRWRNQFERAEIFLTKLRIDDTLDIGAPGPRGSHVATRVRKESSPSSPYPLLVKEYETEAGVLREVARQTEDWPHGDDVPIFSDYKVPRGLEFLVKRRADLAPLRCLLAPPTDDQVAALRREAARVKDFADRWQILIQGQVLSVGTTASFLVGMQNMVELAATEPTFIHELFEIVHEWEMASLAPLLELGIAEMVIVNGFYESLHLWSPSMYRQFFVKPFRTKIEAIHRAGAKVAYNMTSQLLPLLPTFRELGFDILRYLDPVRGETDLVGLKREIGDQLCFIGGVNGAITIGHGSETEVRQATRDAIRILGPGGGLILTAADAIYQDAPWSNAIAMIDEWRACGRYLLSAEALA